MKKYINRLRCFLQGHTPPPYGEGCMVCDREHLTYHEWCVKGIIFRLKSWWKYSGNPISRIHRYFSKCPDCGKRFHRHDESIDHIPF